MLSVLVDECRSGKVSRVLLPATKLTTKPCPVPVPVVKRGPWGPPDTAIIALGAATSSNCPRIV